MERPQDTMLTSAIIVKGATAAMCLADVLLRSHDDDHLTSSVWSPSRLSALEARNEWFQGIRTLRVMIHQVSDEGVQDQGASTNPDPEGRSA